MNIVKYPRTRHLESSRLQAGDIADDKPLAELAGMALVIEEKLDGANCALSFAPDGSLLLQSRGHYLPGGGRERHFALLKTWAATHMDRFWPVLGDPYVMYGEWLFAKHTVFYDLLAHYFFEFDVLDRTTGQFLSTLARKALLAGLPVMPVPVIHTGPIVSVDQVEALIRPSLYRSTDWRTALDQAAIASKSRPDMVARQTDASDLAEGLYIKHEQDGVMQQRFKFVRGDLLQTIQDSEGHWLDRPILANGLAPDVDIFAPVLGIKGPMMPGPDFALLQTLTPRAPDWQIDWARIWALWPELALLDNCPQDPVHHGEGDVGTHTRMVVEALVADMNWRALDGADQAALFWAAVLHDVGKPACTRHEDGGAITSRGHSRVGASIARLMLWRADAPFAWREALCGIIAHHQLPFWLIERDQPDRLAVETSWRCRADHLCLHARADATGRICDDQKDLLDNVDLARVQFDEAGCLSAPFPFANDESRVAFFERDDRDPHYAAHADHCCTVTMMVALPGAGKDTWIAMNRPDVAMVSLDALRTKMDAPATGNQGRVIQAAQNAVRVHLRMGRDFVWNATNVTRQIRARSLRLFRDYGARIEIVYIEPPFEQVIAQNRAREDPVPDDVIHNLARKLEPPGYDEAHAIHHVVGEQQGRA